MDVPRASGPASVDIRPHVRLLHGMRRPANWLQLVRFGLVGGVGFAVNLPSTRSSCTALGVDYHVAAAVAWLVAVVNNFVLNRHWTFDARDGQRPRPGAALPARQPRGAGLQPAPADAVRGGRRHRQGPRPGAGGGGLDAAQLPRQQALELPRERRGSRRRASRGASAPRRPRRAPILWLPPLGGSSCRRWSSTASASTWSASSRSCC